MLQTRMKHDTHRCTSSASSFSQQYKKNSRTKRESAVKWRVLGQTSPRSCHLFTDFQVETFSSTNENILSHWSRGRQSSTSPSRTKGVVAEQMPASKETRAKSHLHGEFQGEVDKCHSFLNDLRTLIHFWKLLTMKLHTFCYRIDAQIDERQVVITARLLLNLQGKNKQDHQISKWSRLITII